MKVSRIMKNATKATKATSTLATDLLKQVTNVEPVAAPAVANTSAKQFIRELLATTGTQMSVVELCKASGKTPVNVITALSDLRSAKYCGKAGVFKTVSSKRADGTTVYQAA